MLQQDKEKSKFLYYPVEHFDSMYSDKKMKLKKER